MPLDSRVKRFLEILAASNPRGALKLSVAERRAGLAQLMLNLSASEIPVGRVEDRFIPGPAGPLAVRMYTPLAESVARPGPLPGLVYFHGGGLIAGSISTHDPIARALASAGACCVISVDYRLAPEHPFPAALEDALAAVNHVSAHAEDFGVDSARLGICGDSAGGTIAAAICQMAARAGSPRLALQFLICPLLDHSRTTGSRRDLADGYFLDQATLQHDLLHYLPPGAGIDPANPLISPLRAEQVSGLPPTIIHTAEFDPLRDEGRDYFDRLLHSGSALAYTCHLGMIHLFYGLGSVIPYARTAIDQMGGEIRQALACTR